MFRVKSGFTSVRDRVKIDAATGAYLKSQLKGKTAAHHDGVLATLKDLVSWIAQSV